MREWLTVKQFLVAHHGTLGRTALYQRISDGTLPSIRLGRIILLPADALDTLLPPSGPNRGAVISVLDQDSDIGSQAGR